jgi:hypothetical protein
MIKESMTSCSIYKSDLAKLDAFKMKKGIRNRADALRICIEFSDAHGALK